MNLISFVGVREEGGVLEGGRKRGVVGAQSPCLQLIIAISKQILGNQNDGDTTISRLLESLGLFCKTAL